ncbi:MAG: iron chelate uptake ABC transporter family permease subunit [Candidatus Heimdallarchaeota archaeon]|nr:iron chelate uptake ABC transporter family permease subunit [Candidatus Heimdallarchaeota archaeon]
MGTFLGFFRALTESWLQKALISAIIIGAVCSLIGVFILLRGMIFLGQAIAHSAFAGAALAILIGVDPILIIIGFSVASAVGVGYVNQKQLMKNEVIIGIIFSFFMALAVLFIGLLKEYSTNIQSILFGQILLVSTEDLILLGIFSALIIMVVLLFKKELYFITFNPNLAKISGLPVNILNYIFLIVVSLTISISLKAIGAILVFAMIVTPAAAAYQWTYKLNRMILLSVFFGILSGIIGLFFSYLLNLASASSIVTVITIVFLISFIFSPKRRSLAKGIKECPFCKDYLPDEDGVCQREECTFTGIPHFHDSERVEIKKHLLPERAPPKHEHEIADEGAKEVSGD